ncbi:MAG: SDR family oxidoreductase [Propionibacteriaceae bacterium]
MTDPRPSPPRLAAIVTGASRGLGAAIARRVAVDGWAVAVNYRSDAAGADAVVASIRATGGTAEALHADVTDEDGVSRLIAATTKRLGPVGAVVANATGPQPGLRLDELSWRAHLDQLEYFVKSPTLLVKAALPSFRARGGGRVVMIGSDMIDRALPASSAYVAAKSAQLGLVKIWAKELGPDHVTVNVVAPGWIPVERHAGVDVTAYEAEVPLGRMGVPADVAAMVAYLISDAGAFVTGQTVTVNGGHVL